MAEDWLRGTWMQTFTGKKFYPMDPKPEDIEIEDIAHALSMLCRYNGHVRRFYSVAEHCVLMSTRVPQEDALWALLHDATEAYVGDMIRPLKVNMPAYVEAEKRVMAAIAKRFDLQPTMPASVKEADNRILFAEREVLMPNHPDSWVGEGEIEPLDVVIECLDPFDAEEMYMQTFKRLTNTPRRNLFIYPGTVRSQKGLDIPRPVC